MPGKSQFGRWYTLRLPRPFPIQIYTSIYSPRGPRDVGASIFFTNPLVNFAYAVSTRGVRYNVSSSTSTLPLHTSLLVPIMSSCSRPSPPLPEPHPHTLVDPKIQPACQRRPGGSQACPAKEALDTAFGKHLPCHVNVHATACPCRGAALRRGG